MRDEPSHTPPNQLASAPSFRKNRWRGPIIALLLLGSLLWITNWFYQRARLFEGAYVSLGEPYLPWGLLIKEEYARDFFGQPVSLGFHQKKLTWYQIRLVSGYTALRSLALQSVTDADVHRLSGLTNLEGLDLYESPISDDGLARIGGMTNLRSLTLRRANLSSAGLRQLSQLPKLNQLGLRSCALKGDFFAELAACAGLEYLYLDESTFTDDMVPSLIILPSLKVVSFGRTGVLRDACIDLKRARPDVTVIDAAFEEVEILPTP